MNKRRIHFKHRKNTVRMVREPDYGHPAWEQDSLPTPDTVPDAFYFRAEPAYPRTQKAETRKKSLSSLSATRLRKRLYASGLKGPELAGVLHEILAGEPVAQGMSVAGTWRVAPFRERFGRRVARAVLRFVHVQLIILDEFGYYASPGLADFVRKAMNTGRKHAAVTLVAQQVLPTPGRIPRRVSFRH